MNRETIIQMAREAGATKFFVENQKPEDADKLHLVGIGFIERFYALAVAKEREECAKVCEEMANPSNVEFSGIGGLKCAAAIRARGEAV